MPTKADLIRRCFAAYYNKERKALEDLFTDDFTFTSPYDDAIDKATYFVRCWPTSERMAKAHDLENIFEQGEAAFVTYKCTTIKGDEFRNTEFFVFDGDRVKHIDVYFGASYRGGKLVPQKE
jgi:ketosteroid isomerase-like protein